MSCAWAHAAANTEFNGGRLLATYAWSTILVVSLRNNEGEKTIIIVHACEITKWQRLVTIHLNDTLFMIGRLSYDL